MKNKEIYTIIERIYSENNPIVYNYSSYKKAIENYNKLRLYYIENYANEDNTNENDHYLEIYDIWSIELYCNELDKDI